MRSIARSGFVAALLVLPPLGCAVGSVLMTDPLLGLAFEPTAQRFEPAPGAIVKELRLRAGQYWLFASYDDSSVGGCRYAVIAGLARPSLDTVPPLEGPLEPDFGVVVARCGSSYRALGVPDRMFTDLGLPQRVIVGLVRDAVARLVLGFGGKEALERTLQEQWKGQLSVAPALADALRDAGVRVRIDK
jgi:hypothetical protein